jgi:hypothetical protein
MEFRDGEEKADDSARGKEAEGSTACKGGREGLEEQNQERLDRVSRKRESSSLLEQLKQLSNDSAHTRGRVAATTCSDAANLRWRCNSAWVDHVVLVVRDLEPAFRTG